MRRRKGPPASRRVRAPFYATTLPAPASRAAHPAECAGLCGAHTHTVGCPALAAGGGRGGFHGRNGTRAARVFRLATPLCHAPTHAASQLHMAHPAQHMTATETHATPRQPRRPHRAWPAHPGTLRPCIHSHPLPAHGSNAPFRVGSAPQRAPAGAVHCEHQPTLQLATHRRTPRSSVPQTRVPPSHGPFRRAGRPSGAAASPPPQRAAPCTAHRSHKTSRDKHRTSASPLPTRCTLPQHSTRAYGV